MGIFELLSFDFGEFIQSPASLFIIAGCLFLAVGIVLYIKGDKKNGEEVTTENESKSGIEETKEIVTDVKPVVIGAEPAPVATNEAEVVGEAPKAETINFDTVSSVAEAAPVIETLDAPVIDTSSIVKTEPAVETLDTPTAYGGANPSATAEVITEEKPREIYGGANPLENTAPIPAETVREAYAGAQLNVTPSVVPAPAIAPVVEPVPVTEPATTAPVVEVAPVVEITPATEPAPVVEPVQMSTEPVEEVEKLEF